MSGDEPSEEAFIASCLLGKGVVSATRKLSMLDLRVWAALCGLYAAEHPEDGRTVETTGYKLADLVFGENHDGGREYLKLKRSLARLFMIAFTVRLVEHHDGLSIETLHEGQEHMVTAIWNATTKLDLTEPRQWGALKGTSSLRVELGSYATKQIEIGACTWLDLDVMRWLGNGLASRVWVALEAWADYRERDLTGGVERTAISLAPPAMNSLGLGGYTKHSDARIKLKQAGLRIVAEDPAYRAIYVAKHMGRWHLYAERLIGSRTRAAARREWRDTRPARLEIRAQARRSLKAANQG